MQDRFHFQTASKYKVGDKNWQQKKKIKEKNSASANINLVKRLKLNNTQRYR